MHASHACDEEVGKIYMHAPQRILAIRNVTALHCRVRRICMCPETVTHFLLECKMLTISMLNIQPALTFNLQPLTFYL